MNNSRVRALELLEIVDPFGPTHIVTGDGNVEDENLLFVEGYFKDCDPPPTSEERELIALFKTFPVEDRRTLWEDFVGY